MPGAERSETGCPAGQQRPKGAATAEPTRKAPTTERTWNLPTPEGEGTARAASMGSMGAFECRTMIERILDSENISRRYAVDCDLQSFFDTVNHQRLMSQLREKIKDPKVLRLIQRYLTAGVVLPDGTREVTPPYYYPQVEAVLTPGFRLEQLDVRLHELLDDLSYLGVVGDHLANLGQLLLAHIDGSRLLLSILIGQAVCHPGG